MTAAQLVLSLLAGSVGGLSGVCLGAYLTHRLMRGMSPLPSLRQSIKVESEKKSDTPPNRPPRLRV